MKKVLVISDNVDLVTCFMAVSKEIPLGHVKFDYRYSSINKNPENLLKLGLSVINVKSADVVREIVSSYDVVFSAHCKQIFPADLVGGVRCINVHPGLNPYNRGWYPQVFSIINKKPVGCTIHLMDEEVDHGDIIHQQEVQVHEWDTSLDVYQRVINAEKSAIKENLLKWIDGEYHVTKMNDEGNYNGIKEYNSLLELDLDSVGSLGEHIDHLRALTHGDFKNAYFISDDSKKVYVRIQLECEN